MTFQYTYQYAQDLQAMQQKVGRAIDSSEDEDYKEDLRDLYNNICLELFEMNRMAEEFEITIKPNSKSFFNP